MLPEITQIYPWLKTLHIACIFLWVGPQLVLAPLLFSLVETPQHDAHRPSAQLAAIDFIVNRLINGAMLSAFVSGGLLTSAYWTSAADFPVWLGLKITLVFLLSTLHGLLFRQYRCARNRRALWSSRRFNLLQAFTGALVLSIVGLVVIKP